MGMWCEVGIACAAVRDSTLTIPRVLFRSLGHPARRQGSRPMCGTGDGSACLPDIGQSDHRRQNMWSPFADDRASGDQYFVRWVLLGYPLVEDYQEERKDGVVSDP